MKVKYLVNKITGEFADIVNMGGCSMIFTSELPIMPLNANCDNNKILKHLNETNSLDLSDYKIVVFDVIESDKIGADIRNKLSPIKNLTSLIDVIDSFSLEDPKFIRVIKNESKRCKKVVKYLSNLL